MDGILNIVVYVIFACSLAWLASKSEEQTEYYGVSVYSWDRYLVWFVAIFVIIAAFRCNVGADHVSYAYKFAHGRADNTGKEPLWNGYVRVAYKYHIYWMLSIALCAFVQIYFITKTLMPYRWMLVFVPFVMFGGRYWMDMMGAVRQMMAACGFFWASRFIYERKLIPYLGFIFIGTLVHQSVIILLPLYLLPRHWSIEGKRVLLSIILVVCVIIGQTPNFTALADYVRSLAEVSNYEEKADYLATSLAGELEEQLSFGPMMWSYLLIQLFIIYWGGKLKEKYAEFIPMFDIWYYLSYIYACIYFLVCNLGHYYIRPLMYLSLFQMALASLLLYHITSEYRKYKLKLSVYLLFWSIVGMNTVWDVWKATPLRHEISTYKLVFFSEQSQRYLGPIL